MVSARGLRLAALGIIGSIQASRISSPQPEKSNAARGLGLSTINGAGHGNGASGSSRRVKVFVYEDAPLNHTDLIKCYREHYDGLPPWQDERADMAQDMGEVWLHRSMLNHPWRVHDPEEADLFYVPIYPVLSFKLLARNNEKCGGRTHQERISDAIMHLEKQSPYFKRYGGADHVLICAWWNCRHALGREVRMRLSRSILGINEGIPGWADWGCGKRLVTVPYTANSVSTRALEFGGGSTKDRYIPFFFVGTSRSRQERQSLKVVKDLFPESVIELGEDGYMWSENATTYSQKMAHSRFCFTPRGDSMSSRRIFDAVASGCIPVLTASEARAVPFIRTSVELSSFAVVTPLGSFDTEDSVANIVKDLHSMPEDKLASLRRGVAEVSADLVYGVSTGDKLEDMHPFSSVASNFLLESWHRFVGKDVDVGGSPSQSKGEVWSCPRVDVPVERLSPRTWTPVDEVSGTRRQWLTDSETIMNRDHKLLFCAPPNTGSMQFRMLAKRMQGVDHWSSTSYRSLLFDPTASGVTLLDTDDEELLQNIFWDNGAGWVKIAVVRDPITRLLSAYLDLARIRESNANDQHPRRRRLGETQGSRETSSMELGTEDARQSGSRLRGGPSGHTSSKCSGQRAEGCNQEEGALAGDYGEEGLGVQGTVNLRGKRRLDGGGVHTEWRKQEPDTSIFDEHGHGQMLPFGDFVKSLKVQMPSAPAAFRPISSMCGLRHAEYDSIIPFERLRKTGKEVLKSLPGGLWKQYGEKGWGPASNKGFLEFDYGGAASWLPGYGNADVKDGKSRTEDLFAGSSCEWTKYYSDQKILDNAIAIYASDFNQFGWYDRDAWRERLHGCLAS